MEAVTALGLRDVETRRGRAGNEIRGEGSGTRPVVRGAYGEIENVDNEFGDGKDGDG